MVPEPRLSNFHQSSRCNFQATPGQRHIPGPVSETLSANKLFSALPLLQAGEGIAGSYPAKTILHFSLEPSPGPDLAES